MLRASALCPDSEAPGLDVPLAQWLEGFRQKKVSRVEECRGFQIFGAGCEAFRWHVQVLRVWPGGVI